MICQRVHTGCASHIQRDSEALGQAQAFAALTAEQFVVAPLRGVGHLVAATAQRMQRRVGVDVQNSVDHVGGCQS